MWRAAAARRHRKRVVRTMITTTHMAYGCCCTTATCAWCSAASAPPRARTALRSRSTVVARYCAPVATLRPLTRPYCISTVRRTRAPQSAAGACRSLIDAMQGAWSGGARRRAACGLAQAAAKRTLRRLRNGSSRRIFAVRSPRRDGNIKIVRKRVRACTDMRCAVAGPCTLADATAESTHLGVAERASPRRRQRV